MKKKRFFIFVLLGIFLISSLSFAQPPYAGCPGPPNHEDGLIVVHNPLGQPPDKEMFSLAPRFDTLEGETIYIVDVKYPSTTNFRDELIAALQERYPETNFVFAEKKGTYFEDDPELWEQIKAEGAGMIIFIGH